MEDIFWVIVNTDSGIGSSAEVKSISFLKDEPYFDIHFNGYNVLLSRFRRIKDSRIGS